MAVPKGTQLFGESTIAEAVGDAAEAAAGARFWREVRSLAFKELLIARKVFRQTIPWNHVFVTDGLGFSGRPFTMPVPWTRRSYMLHVGPQGYTGMSYLKEDAELLIHELTHVWQGERAHWSWNFVLRSGWHQATSKDAYAYDQSTAALEKADWGTYNPEQQASIVEHWFGAGMPGEPFDPALLFMDSWFSGYREKEFEYDPRYRLIVTGIRGEAMPIKLPPTREALTTRSSYSAREDPVPVTEEYLTRTLARRFAAQDVAGYKARVEDLRLAFRDLSPERARLYISRLTARRPGDKVALYFQAHLAGYERKILMDTLQSRAMGRPVV